MSTTLFSMGSNSSSGLFPLADAPIHLDCIEQPGHVVPDPHSHGCSSNLQSAAHLSCRAFAKKLNDAPLAIVDKRRSAHNVSEVMNLIGDVEGKVAVLVDDMIDTAGTITNAAKVSARSSLMYWELRHWRCSRASCRSALAQCVREGQVLSSSPGRPSPAA